MAILSQMYPCKECADHFKEVLRANPVQTGSHDEFSQWLCHVYNVVNRRFLCLIYGFIQTALANWCSPVNELMRGGVSWSASNAHVTCRGLRILETYLSSGACMKFGIQDSMLPMLDENIVLL
ncbi:hypothetical protein EZV62_011086 [Acer yangbiense]|uniref:Sulfhydryl oxidase n=1 Tax=Acer yangbiense TaxID=1000413 RepID=A0A5C7I6C1_9ROSI|nr:hypothetical protein EZV62_011086 [Acer yangbiense]